MDEEGTEGNTPCSFLRGGDPPAQREVVGLFASMPLSPALHCYPQSHPGILSSLSAWLWGLLGLPQHAGF